MAAKKFDPSKFTGFIVHGEAELERQSPAQRGIKAKKEHELQAVEPAKAEASKKRFTVNLDREAIVLAQRAAYWDRLTLSELVEEAIRREVARLEKKRGEPYPEDKVNPIKGAPRKFVR